MAERVAKRVTERLVERVAEKLKADRNIKTSRVRTPQPQSSEANSQEFSRVAERVAKK